MNLIEYYDSSRRFVEVKLDNSAEVYTESSLSIILREIIQPSLVDVNNDNQYQQLQIVHSAKLNFRFVLCIHTYIHLFPQ